MEIIGIIKRKFFISVKNVVIYKLLEEKNEICRKRINVGGISNGIKKGRIFKKA